MRSRSWAIVGLYALLALLAVPIYPHFLSPNEFTRWALASSLVERGTPEISSALLLLGPAFEDVSEKDGRVYSNKAPGATLVALPGYVLARGLLGPPSPSSVRPVLWAMRLFGATLPAALLTLAFFHAAVRSGASPTRAVGAAFALLFATPLFAYGLLLFSHALVAACLFGGWIALFAPGDPSRSFRRDLVGGALLGLAVISEYPAAVPAGVLALCAVVPAPRRALALAAGAAPFAALLGVYDLACFGGVLELSSAHERASGFRSLASTGFFGISLPSPGIVLRLLADPSKGLLVFSPFLVLWPGALHSSRGALPFGGRLALGLVPLSLLLLYAGYPNWHGGFSVGPRYLVAALPFLVFPFAFGKGGFFESALVGASTLAVCATTLAFPFVPPGFALPWGSFAAFFFERGLTAPNALHLVAPAAARFVLPAIVAVAVYFFLRGKREEKDSSEGKRERKSLLEGEREEKIFLEGKKEGIGSGRGRTGLAFLCGAAACLALGFLLSKQISLLSLSFPPSPSLLLQRAYIADVYFEQRGALEEEIARTGIPQPRLLARRERELALPPPPWPFAPVSR
ncbi:MAG TPA: hypothetical protein VLJ18_09905 [Thermoanaerobaculia bacterium]|nr:hypothetical protein [Thermoanaerobaculia bacterium]